jgi:hypothetical protein
LFNGVTLIASIGIAGYAQRKRIGSIEKRLSSSALAGPVKASSGDAGATKAASLQAHPVPTPDLLDRAHNTVGRVSTAITSISEAENDQARERAWRAAMADEAIGAEVRRLTRPAAR